MSLLSNIGNAVVKTVTAPFRFVGNVAKMGWEMASIAGNLLTGDIAGAKRNLGELWDATKGAAFSGVETAFLALGGIGAIGAKATIGAAATSMGGKILGTAAVKETAKGVGGAFVTAYAENHVRN
jgi:hypothetical protein